MKTPLWKYAFVVLALLMSVVRLASGGTYTGPWHWLSLALGGAACLIYYAATGRLPVARRFQKFTLRHGVFLVVASLLVWFFASHVFDVYNTALAQASGGD